MPAVSPSSPLRPQFDLANPATLRLDLRNPKPKDVLALHEAFAAAMRAPNFDPGPLPIQQNGWHEITPAIAVNLLLRNPPGTNRWIDPGKIFYYANQMAADDWQPTGQPILINILALLKDAQHRLYGVVISGKTIKSYVIIDVPDIPQLFAYIDNSFARSPAAALQTAGFDGVSPIMAKAIRFAEEVRVGVHNPTGPAKLARLSPADTLRLVQNYPNIQDAAQSTASDWQPVVQYLKTNRKEIVAYVGMKIIEEHDDTTADDFFSDLMDGTERANDHPVTMFRKMVDADGRRTKQMPRQNMGANLILAFNAWYQQRSLARRWEWNADTENFPALTPATEAPEAEAAE